MSDLPTIAELQADKEKLIRITTDVLNPGPWKHNLAVDWNLNKPITSRTISEAAAQNVYYRCTRCQANVELTKDQIESEERYFLPGGRGFILSSKEKTCTVPPDLGLSLPEIAEQLVRKVMDMPHWTKKLVDAIQNFRGYLAIGGVWYTVGTALVWFLKATPTDKCICCLIALGKAKAA
jgi:hypothetical protein